MTKTQNEYSVSIHLESLMTFFTVLLLKISVSLSIDTYQNSRTSKKVDGNGAQKDVFHPPPLRIASHSDKITDKITSVVA